MIDTRKGVTTVRPWVTNWLDYQWKFLDAQYRASQKMLETMFRAPPVSESPPAALPKLKEPPKMDEPKAETRQPVTPVPEATSVPAAVDAHNRKIKGKVAIVTGGASGIGQAVCRQFVNRGIRAIALVDLSNSVRDVAASLNELAGKEVAIPMIGNTADDNFRKEVFDQLVSRFGIVNILVPAAGITRDRLSVKLDKATGKSDIYPVDTFREVTEVNLIAPIYWALEMVARIAEDRWQRGKTRWEPDEGVQGTAVFIGSVSSQGNKGQIAYAVAKAGMEGAAATLMKEAIFHGVRCAVIHPGFTDTPMVRALGEDYIKKYVLPYTQLRRLIRPDEIAEAICFMINNSAVSGELWADAGWHPSA